MRPGRRVSAAIVIAASVTVLGLIGLAADVFAGFRRQAADALFPSDELDSRLLVVGVDARSILETAEPWPWPRSLQARMIDELTKAGASMVLLDVLYHPATDDDPALAEALARAPDAVLAAAAELAGEGALPLLRAPFLTEPVAPVAAVAAVGHVNITPDSADAVVRALPLAIEGPDGAVVPSLTLVALGRLEGLGGQVILRRNGIQLGDRFLPTDSLGRLEINYTAALRSGAPDVPYRSAADVVGGRLRPGELEGRVVLVGATDPALGDAHVTPVDKGGRMPGVFIHANALNTLLTRSYLTPASDVRTVAWIFGLAALVAGATLALPLWGAALVAGAAVAAHVVIGIARFRSGLVVDLLYPTLAVAVAFVAALAFRSAMEARDRRRIGEVLHQYVPPDIARQLIDKGAPGGHLPSGTITFMFTDVVGSTATWESHPREMGRAMRMHDSIIESSVQVNGGA
ncbi:MAG TPA: CHASE2 domain-containing protein, partial [Acidimicrobiales bacterium]